MALSPSSKVFLSMAAIAMLFPIPVYAVSVLVSFGHGIKRSFEFSREHGGWMLIPCLWIATMISATPILNSFISAKIISGG